MDWQDLFDPYMRHRRPGQREAIWLWRDTWPEPQLTTYGDINPLFNAIGAKWAKAIDGQGPPPLPSPQQQEMK